MEGAEATRRSLLTRCLSARRRCAPLRRHPTQAQDLQSCADEEYQNDSATPSTISVTIDRHIGHPLSSRWSSTTEPWPPSAQMLTMARLPGGLVESSLTL